MDKTMDLCIWKDLYYLYERGYSTTFEDSENWGSEHNLYKCIGCGGYDFDCGGYKSLKSISRKKNNRQ